MYLLDTNICVYVIRKRPESVYCRLSSVGERNVAISVITAFELEVGALRAPGKAYSEAVRLLIAELPVLPLEDSARTAYGQLRTALERRGEKIGAYDMLIAAHVLSLDATLVTNNEKEFKRVKGLKVENWAV
ncbi:MAG: type II toxin-antitoxin system VapC family toxin [Betaproteobacteria bacterium]|nr:type II toxin-antitoxin system VapC family toxin [Betaproteobacteria bacterium]